MGSRLMALRCNRCGQDEPHLGDSWCLACSATEAINGELRSGWGNPGSRSVATDILVSATRQLRALRRLGIAGAGRGRPSIPEGAGPRAPPVASGPKPEPRASPAAAGPREPSHPPPGRDPEPDPPQGDKKVKEEKAPSEGSDYSEGEESETQVDDKEVPLEHSGLKAVPKKEAKSVSRSEIPRRRTHERSDAERDRSRHRSRASSHRHHETRREHRPRDEEHSRRRRRSRSRHRSNQEAKPKRKRRNRPGHRGGGKHQRLYRAASDPFKRLHYKKPDEFWDQRPELR